LMETVNDPDWATTLWIPGFVGAMGAGVTVTVLLTGDEPALFAAVTATTYFVPFFRPVMRHVNGPLDHWQVFGASELPLADAEAVYPVMLVPPKANGADQVTFTALLVGLTETARGGEGGSSGTAVTVGEGSEPPIVFATYAVRAYARPSTKLGAVIVVTPFDPTDAFTAFTMSPV